MKQIRAILVAVSLLLPFSLPADELKPFDGPAPPLALPDIKGKIHHLPDYRGRVVLVHFWATYCTPCRTEMPSMNRLLDQMGDRLAVLAVDMGEPQAQVLEFIAEVKPEFTILLDEGGEAIQAWKVFAVPSTFVIDPAGRIRYTLYGAAEWDAPEIRKPLEDLLE